MDQRTATLCKHVAALHLTVRRFEEPGRRSPSSTTSTSAPTTTRSSRSRRPSPTRGAVGCEPDGARVRERGGAIELLRWACGSVDAATLRERHPDDLDAFRSALHEARQRGRCRAPRYLVTTRSATLVLPATTSTSTGAEGSPACAPTHGRAPRSVRARRAAGKSPASPSPAPAVPSPWRRCSTIDMTRSPLWSSTTPRTWPAGATQPCRGPSPDARRPRRPRARTARTCCSRPRACRCRQARPRRPRRRPRRSPRARCRASSCSCSRPRRRRPPRPSSPARGEACPRVRAASRTRRTSARSTGSASAWVIPDAHRAGAQREVLAHLRRVDGDVQLQLRLHDRARRGVADLVTPRLDVGEGVGPALPSSRGDRQSPTPPRHRRRSRARRRRPTSRRRRRTHVPKPAPARAAPP